MQKQSFWIKLSGRRVDSCIRVSSTYHIPHSSFCIAQFLLPLKSSDWIPLWKVIYASGERRIYPDDEDMFLINAQNSWTSSFYSLPSDRRSRCDDLSDPMVHLMNHFWTDYVGVEGKNDWKGLISSERVADHFSGYFMMSSSTFSRCFRFGFRPCFWGAALYLVQLALCANQWYSSLQLRRPRCDSRYNNFCRRVVPIMKLEMPVREMVIFLN